MKILIVGATGVLGKAATLRFLQTNNEVIALARNAEKVRELEKLGAKIIVADVLDFDKIISACEGIDVVITAFHSLLGKGNSMEMVDDKAHRNLIKAAMQGGVKQFIYTSVAGISGDSPVDFFRTKHGIEQALTAETMHYTILRLPPFMEWHLHNLLGKSIMEKGKVTILGKGNALCNYIAAADIAEGLVQIAGNMNFYNKIVTLAGPDNISKNEAAALYAKALGAPAKIGHAQVGLLKILAPVIKPFHPGIARILQMSIAGDEHDGSLDKKFTVAQFGLMPTSVFAFIQKQVMLSK